FSLAFHLDSGFMARDIVASVQGRQFHFGELAVESPFFLDIRGRRWPDLEFSIRDLRIARPLPVGIERIAGKITGPWTTAQIKGDFHLQTGNKMLAALGLPGKITRPYAVDGDFQGSLKEGMISWALQARGKQGIFLSLGTDSLRGRLDLNASLRGDAQRLRASAACRMPGAELQLAGYRAGAEVCSGNAEVEYVFGGNFSGRGRVELSSGHVAASEAGGLDAAGIRLNLPWQWPSSGPAPEGGFSITRLQSNGMRWQDISGTAVQKDALLRFSGSMHSVLTRIAVAFQGIVAPEPGGGGLQADFSLPLVVLPAGTDLRPLHPLLQGTSGGGRFQAEGRIWARDDSAGGSATMKIAEADFEQKEEGIAVLGINSSVTLASLFDFVTAPAQRIAFRELKWQDKSFSNGELIFAGESGGTVFIESGRFDWCGGKVMIAPFRLEPGKTDFLITLYCDRVNFAQMLNALLGKVVVSGDAEMNGIVPVRMVNGSPVFVDGYLYSTPGSSGNLKVSQPELISGGQVLVEEAIRDFRYNWIKIKLSSRDDLLDMVVSIDGAPAQKLPLRYDARQKDFVKDPAGGRHVQLKGLLLD
ncbi:MAG: YdbH domain-containing protein, partial [Candidatus Aminicenantes bacterium]|nr:YdbH domain-containing protein [Candidatus Aminicenantes bacterium]